MDPPLPIDGVLPPDLAGTLVRIGPGPGAVGGALHAVELRDGTAVSYLTRPSSADANVFWHAGKVLALAETGLPQQFSRVLEPEETEGGISVPVASHVHRDAVTGGRVLFGVVPPTEDAPPFLRLGEWDAAGALSHQMEVPLDRATWQHDIGVTARHIVFIESPTEYAEDLTSGEEDGAGGEGVEGEGEGEGEGEDDGGGPAGDRGPSGGGGPERRVAVPFRWTPGAEGWVGVLDREGDGSDVQWVRVDPCLVTHVLHAHDDGDAVVLYVCRYETPEAGRPVDLTRSVVGPSGIGESLIGDGLPNVERWRIEGGHLERRQIDERFVEYATSDPTCEGAPFRYGYGVEVAPNHDRSVDAAVDHLGLLRFDMARDEVAAWNPGPYRTASEPLFARAADGRSDDEGWLLTMVYDAPRGASDLYVLDASSFGRRPQAVIHLPAGAALPFRSHGTWISADRYR
jgi:carotenoid cleavage dioxygenase